MTLLPRRRKIAIVELFGMVGGTVKPAAFERLLAAVRRARSIRALVLDIDSPGGSGPASDYLYRAVARIREEKPVVACIRGIGASGAYMIGCGATRIVASPGALVGSIGVISVRPVFQELLRRLGIDVAVSKSGAYKDMGALWRHSTPEESRKLQTLVDEFHDDFVSIVAQERSKEESDVRELATGEVFRAGRALELGLVDELGDLDRAVDVAAELSGAPRRITHLRARRTLRERLFGPLAESLVEATASEVERRLLMESLKL